MNKEELKEFMINERCPITKLEVRLCAKTDVKDKYSVVVNKYTYVKDVDKDGNFFPEKINSWCDSLDEHIKKEYSGYLESEGITYNIRTWDY